MTLEPGDVVTTGTPAGIGAMKPGDTVEVVGPDCKPFSMVVPEMRDAEGFTLLEPRNPRMIFTMQLPRSVPAMSFVRHAVDLSARD